VHAVSHDATEKEESIREIIHSMTNWEKDKSPVGYVYPGQNFPSHPMGNTSPAAFSSVSSSQQLGEEENTYASLKLFILQHAVTTKHGHVPSGGFLKRPWWPMSKHAFLSARPEPAMASPEAELRPKEGSAIQEGSSGSQVKGDRLTRMLARRPQKEQLAGSPAPEPLIPPTSLPCGWMSQASDTRQQHQRIRGSVGPGL